MNINIEPIDRLKQMLDFHYIELHRKNVSESYKRVQRNKIRVLQIMIVSNIITELAIAKDKWVL